MDDMGAKEDARLLKNALKNWSKALAEGNGSLAEDAAEVFEKVGADKLAEKARNFAAVCKPNEKGTLVLTVRA